MGTKNKKELTKSQRFLALQLICGVLYVIGLLLLARGCPEAGIAVFGLAFIIHAYSFWLLSIPNGDSSPIAFARDVYKTIPIIFALLGVAALLQALGALAGLGGLERAGNALGEFFGWI